MFSLLQTSRNAYKEGDVPADEYDWGARPSWMFFDVSGRARYGVKRVETKRFVRFEHIRVVRNEKKHGYWFNRKSFWFIKVPFCKNDKELLIANIAIWFIAIPSFMKILGSVMTYIANAIVSQGT